MMTPKNQHLELVSTQHQHELTTVEAYRTKIQTWILRILLDLKCYRHVTTKFWVDVEDLANLLEIELAPGEKADDAFTTIRLAPLLIELESKRFEISGVFSSNIRCLSRMLSLSSTEESILEFLLLLNKSTELRDVTGLIGDDLTLGEVIELLPVILDCSQEEINAALKSDALLIKSGLLRVVPESRTLRKKLCLFGHLLDCISVPQTHSADFLEQFVDRAAAPQLTPEDFDDYKDDYSLLKRYLKGVLKNNVSGSNVLIHGLPGVGKTQIVHTLCAEIGVDLFEVASQSSDNEPLSGSSRLSAYLLSQQLLSKREDAVLLFDEVEEVFPGADDSWRSGGGVSSSKKSWFNHQLESNVLPVFWLANNISHLNSAYIRRFDIVLELHPMKASARRKFLEKSCRINGLKSGSWINKAAECRNLSPALIKKITHVMGQVEPDETESEHELFEKLANGALGAMDSPLLNLAPPNRNTSLPYNIGLLNTETDMDSLIKGLKRRGEGRLLCYGPPGTGKTAFAKHLADSLNKPLLQFRASDILGQFIGMTEKNLAKAFKKSKDEGAIMLLDEIDSLLRSRDNASKTWEVSQVNELLIQMEDFNGILLACTNHKSTLDGAASRRFDLKIEFDYIEPDKAWNFFQKIIRSHKVTFGRKKSAVKNRVMKLESLTPGDYKTVTRKLSLTGDGVTALGLIEGLESEVKDRVFPKSREIGFTASF